MSTGASSFTVGLVILIIIAVAVTACVLALRPSSSSSSSKGFTVETSSSTPTLTNLQHSGDRDNGSITFTLTAPTTFELIIKYVVPFSSNPTTVTNPPGLATAPTAAGFSIVYASPVAAGNYDFTFTNTL